MIVLQPELEVYPIGEGSLPSSDLLEFRVLERTMVMELIFLFSEGQFLNYGRQAYYHPDLQSDYLGVNPKRGTYFSKVCACFMSQNQVKS